MAPEGMLVLDASTLVEMVGDGRHRAGADALLDRVEEPDPPSLVTAGHALLEAMGALRRMEMSGRLDSAVAGDAVSRLARLPLVLDPTLPRVARIWSLRGSMTTYDSAYAAAADALGAPLVTVDDRLLRACTAHGIPAVHLDDLAA